MLVYVRPSNEALLRVRVPGAQDQCGCSSIPSSAVLIPRIALFDRPEHRFFEFPQWQVLRITQGLQFPIEILKWLDRSFIRNLAERPRHFREHRPVGLCIL